MDNVSDKRPVIRAILISTLLSTLSLFYSMPNKLLPLKQIIFELRILS